MVPAPKTPSPRKPADTNAALKLTPLKSAKSVNGYYGPKFVADYFASDEIHLTLQGKYAKELGLPTGPMERKLFRTLLDGKLPDGSSLTKRWKSDRIVAFECCLGVPKTISDKLLLDGDRRVMKRVLAAAGIVMKELESFAAVSVGTGPLKGTNRTTGNLIFVVIPEFISRPVAGEVPSPHVHLHIIIFNATRVQPEVWRALDAGEIFAHVQELQAIFLTELSRQMQSLDQGIVWQRAAWDLHGKSSAVVDALSARTCNIYSEAEARGIRDPEEIKALSKDLRQPQGAEIPMEKLIPKWRTLRDAHLAEHPETGPLAPATIPEDISAREALLRGQRYLETKAWSWSQDALLAAALYAARQPVQEALRRELKVIEGEPTNDPQHLVWCNMGEKKVYTTGAILDAIERCIEISQATKGRLDAIDDSSLESPSIPAGERHVLARILNCRDMVSVLDVADGKERVALIEKIVRAAGRADHEIIAIGGTAKSVAYLRKDGFDSMDPGQFCERAKAFDPSRKLIIIDEAGFIGAESMARVLAAAQAMPARVVLVGNVHQKTAINSGDALHLLACRAELTLASPRRPFEVNNNGLLGVLDAGACPTSLNLVTPSPRPATTDDSAAVGKPVPVPTAIRHGEVSVVILSGERLQAAVAKAVELATSKVSLVIVADPLYAYRLTDAVRREILESPNSGPRIARWIDFLVEQQPVNTALAAKSGDLLQFRNASAWAKPGDEFKVTRVVDDKTVLVDDHGESRSVRLKPGEHRLFRPVPHRVVVGDRLKFTEDLVTTDHFMVTGELVTVKDFGSTGEIQVSGGRSVPAHYRHLDYGWVVSPGGPKPSHVKCAIVVDLSSAPASPLAKLCAWAAGFAARLMVFTGAASLVDKIGFGQKRKTLMNAFQAPNVALGAAQPPCPKTTPALAVTTLPYPILIEDVLAELQAKDTSKVATATSTPPTVGTSQEQGIEAAATDIVPDEILAIPPIASSSPVALPTKRPVAPQVTPVTYYLQSPSSYKKKADGYTLTEIINGIKKKEITPASTLRTSGVSDTGWRPAMSYAELRKDLEEQWPPAKHVAAQQSQIQAPLQAGQETSSLQLTQGRACPTINGKRSHPLFLSQIRELIAAGIITPATLISPTLDGEDVLASSLPELAKAFQSHLARIQPSPAQIPPSAVPMDRSETSGGFSQSKDNSTPPSGPRPSGGDQAPPLSGGSQPDR